MKAKPSPQGAGCMVCGKVAAEASSVTCGAVRCNAWLGDVGHWMYLSVEELEYTIQEEEFRLKNQPYSEMALRAGLNVLLELKGAIRQKQPDHKFATLRPESFFPLCAYKNPSPVWLKQRLDELAQKEKAQTP